MAFAYQSSETVAGLSDILALFRSAAVAIR